MGQPLEVAPDAVNRGLAVRRAGAVGALARVTGLLSNIALAPLALHHLGQRDFGIFMTLLSSITLLGFADLGIGQGLISAVATARAEGDLTRVHRLVSTAVGMLAAIGIGGAALVVVVGGVVSATAAVPSWSLSVAVGLGLMLAGLPLSVAAAARSGLNESFASVAWTALTGPLQFVSVALVVACGGRLTAMIAAYSAAALATAAGDTILTLLGSRRWLRPTRAAFRAELVRPLLRRGSLFLILAVAGAVAFSTDTVVISAVLGARAAATYSVAFRLFSLAPLFIGLFLAPLWPAYSDALARSDVPWLRATLRRSWAGSIVLNVVAAGVLLVTGRVLLKVWLGSDLGAPRGLLLALACQAVVIGASVPPAMYLNGTNVVRFQVVIALSMAGANLFASVVLAHVIGVSGTAWGTVLAQGLLVLIPYSVFVPRHLARLTTTVPGAPRTHAPSHRPSATM